MNPTHDLTTTKTDIGTLRPHPTNPRNGDTDAIAESLTVNGQYRPIVTTHDGTILAGNHTYMAAMELGWEVIDTVSLNIDPDSPEALRIMLADNRTADLGGYDDGILLTLLETLQPVTLEGSGYKEQDLDVLRSILEHAGDDPFGDDQAIADAVQQATLPTIIITEVPHELHDAWNRIPGEPIGRLAALLDAYNQ